MKLIDDGTGETLTLKMPDPTICPHGEKWVKCKEQSCIDEMIRLEDAAICEHGFLAGCPHC